jgi:hypothetical protein
MSIILERIDNGYVLYYPTYTIQGGSNNPTAVQTGTVRKFFPTLETVIAHICAIYRHDATFERVKVEPVEEPIKYRNVRVEVVKGLKVSVGEDGHWVEFESGGKFTAFNVENALNFATSKGAIDWIDRFVESRLSDASAGEEPSRAAPITVRSADHQEE